MARGEGDSVYCEGCGGDLPDQVYAGPDGDGQAMFIRRADDEDAAIDESLEACRILGIDTSGDYNYLGTLRALVADVAKLREALSPRSASWSQRALDVAPLLLGLCASASADDRGAIRVRNGTKPPQTPITDSQEGAIEVFLESGPAAMVALVEERDELRLEILALRGDKAGATSERWVWTAPCWRIHGADGELLAKVATTNLLAWTRNGDIDAGGIEQATSVRDGMRRCEARLAGGAS